MLWFLQIRQFDLAVLPRFRLQGDFPDVCLQLAEAHTTKSKKDELKTFLTWPRNGTVPVCVVAAPSLPQQLPILLIHRQFTIDY
jgi:hypothetical protein